LVTLYKLESDILGSANIRQDVLVLRFYFYSIRCYVQTTLDKTERRQAGRHETKFSQTGQIPYHHLLTQTPLSLLLSFLLNRKIVMQLIAPRHELM